MFIETLACAHVQQALYCRWFVCVRPSVHRFLGNRSNSERETWTYYEVGGMHGKLRFWSGEGREAGETDGC